MAKKTGAYEAPTPASDKRKALDTAIAQIEKTFGKGTVMRLGDKPEMNVEAIIRILHQVAADKGRLTFPLCFLICLEFVIIIQ